MKILLVSPCRKSEIRPDQFSIPQLTLSLIAAMTPAPHEVQVCEEVYGDVIDFDAPVDLVGISLMSQTSLRGYEIANEFRRRGRMVVFGGIHATACPGEALRYGDAVVIGEAENGLWEKVLSDAAAKRLKPFYRLDGLPDLREHVAPRRDLIKCTSGTFDIAPIEATRGCPYNCDFCSVSRFFGVKQRHKPVRAIIGDAASCPQKHLFFVDDNIALDRKFATELFTGLIPLKKKWVGQASISLAKDENMMRLARRSGCRALLIGLESLTDAGSGSYRKTLKTIRENAEAIRRLRDHGIMVMVSVVFGLDSDTKEVFSLTEEFVDKAKPAFLQACLMTPYPGTQVYENLKAQRRILTDDWSRFDTKKVVISPGLLTPEELAYGYELVRSAACGTGSILARSLPHILMGRSEALLYFSLNLGARATLKKSEKMNVYRNAPGSPVDFDTSKYVKPFKPGHR